MITDYGMIHSMICTGLQITDYRRFITVRVETRTGTGSVES